MRGSGSWIWRKREQLGEIKIQAQRDREVRRGGAGSAHRTGKGAMREKWAEGLQPVPWC